MVAPADDSDPRVPWNAIGRWALIGTLVICLWVFVDVRRSGNNPLNFIQPGANGPSAAVIHRDFPAVELPPGRPAPGAVE